MLSFKVTLTYIVTDEELGMGVSHSPFLGWNGYNGLSDII